jgi:hypothetical protein
MAGFRPLLPPLEGGVDPGAAGAAEVDATAPSCEGGGAAAVGETGLEGSDGGWP